MATNQDIESVNNQEKEGIANQEMEGVTEQQNGIHVDEKSTKPPENKRAMQVLNMWCLNRGLPLPKYSLDHYGGQSHRPSFTFTVTLGDLPPASGTAGSKKLAKHAAAQAFLDAITEQMSSENGCAVPAVEPMDQEKVKNAAMILQERCKEHGWTLPVYDNQQVVITCKLEGKEVQGYGISRKGAKRAAATNMLQLLDNEHLPTQESWRTGV